MDILLHFFPSSFSLLSIFGSFYWHVPKLTDFFSLPVSSLLTSPLKVFFVSVIIVFISSICFDTFLAFLFLCLHYPPKLVCCTFPTSVVSMFIVDIINFWCDNSKISTISEYGMDVFSESPVVFGAGGGAASWLLSSINFLLLLLQPFQGFYNQFYILNLSLVGIFRKVILDIREGNGNPLQYSRLENPMDGGAW